MHFEPLRAWVLYCASIASIGVFPGASAARGQDVPTPGITESPLNREPVDGAVTPDGLRAVVRCTGAAGGDQFTVWNFSTTHWTPIGCQQPSTRYLISDAVQTTNSRAIAIGSDATTTYVDIVQVDITPPTCLYSASFPNAGEANDVAITPNGAFAIVNSKDWVHVLDLTNAQLAAAFNIGATPPSFSPNGIADSIVCTDATAIVTTRRVVGTSSQCWVYWVNLLAPSISTGHLLYDGAAPHDIALTPNGELAVVTTTNAKLGLYYMRDGSFLTPTGQAHPSSHGTQIVYRYNVDSVEVTNDRAVMISDFLVGGVLQYHVDVVGISATWPYLNPVADIHDFAGETDENRAHDLAIAPDFPTVAIRTQQDFVFIQDISLTPPPPLVVFRQQNLRGDPMASLAPGSPDSFVSDSIVIAPKPTPSGRRIAVTIGSQLPLAPPLFHRGYISFLDVAVGQGPTPFLGDVEIVSPVANEHCVPGDLSLTRDLTRAIVRLSAPTSDWNNGTADIVLFTLPTPSAGPVIEWQIGATGDLLGVDSIEVGRNRAISISQPVGGGPGWVQIVRL